MGRISKRAKRGAPAVQRGIGVEGLNAINVALMLGTAAVAWVIPFELFLASYAVLGPLHYLTEISWLHDRSYFTTSRHAAVLFVGLGVLAFLTRFTDLGLWDGWVVLAFGLAAVFAFGTSPRSMLAFATATGLACFALTKWNAAWWFLIVMLPTVIHVYVFTALFILEGSLRSRSPWGYVSFAVFLSCSMALLFFRPPAAQYAVSPRTAALATEFGAVLEQLGTRTGAPADWDRLAAIGRFLAFIYTYHYLNWFSKTGIIRWHEVGGGRLASIIVLYAASLGLYAYDYRVGLVALGFLSLLHVLLEFPLDLRTIAGLGGRAASAVLPALGHHR